MIRTLKPLENSGQLNGVTEKVIDEKKKKQKGGVPAASMVHMNVSLIAPTASSFSENMFGKGVNGTKERLQGGILSFIWLALLKIIS